MKENVWAVVLAGGIGSRFWPLSTPSQPKQLLPLVDDQPMLLNSVERLLPLVPYERLLVSTNDTLVEPIRDVAPRIPTRNIIPEPHPAGTAAALAWTAAEIERRSGPDSVMICVHADWSIGDPEEFRRTLSSAVAVAEETHGLVTVGIVPTRPDPGFGYIEPGEQIQSEKSEGARKVARFVEKPTRDRAAEMVNQGYLWNSGIFVWRVGDFLGEIRNHTPEVSSALKSFSLETNDIGKFFDSVESVSVDVGVLERSEKVFVIPGDFGWDDVGTWAALGRVRDLDDHGNAKTDNAHAVEAKNNVIYSEDGSCIVAYGVSDLVVVVREGLTVVTTVDKSADIKTLLENLPAHIRNISETSNNS